MFEIPKIHICDTCNVRKIILQISLAPVWGFLEFEGHFIYIDTHFVPPQSRNTTAPGSPHNVEKCSVRFTASRRSLRARPRLRDAALAISAVVGPVSRSQFFLVGSIQDDAAAWLRGCGGGREGFGCELRFCTLRTHPWVVSTCGKAGHCRSISSPLAS